MTRIRTVDEFLDPKHGFNPTPAERALIEACRAGEKCKLGDGTRPEEDSEARRVRAELIRLLILGGTEACGLDGSGVWLVGAWVKGVLDLQHRSGKGAISLKSCYFEHGPLLDHTKLERLNFASSALPCIHAHRLAVNGSVVLRRVKIKDKVDFSHAKFNGHLSCEHAEIDSKKGLALDANGIIVKRGVFLKHATIKGTITLVGAKIDGHLVCSEATLGGGSTSSKDDAPISLNCQGITIRQSMFLDKINATGTLDINASKIIGQLNCENSILNGSGGYALNAQGVSVGQALFLCGIKSKGALDINGANISGQLSLTGAELDGTGKNALNAQRLHVEHGFFFRDLKLAAGDVCLAAAHVGDLADDFSSWQKISGTLDLDGFTYDRFFGAPINIEGRLDWLKAGSWFNNIFSPQPYSQLAKVLSISGHKRMARRVLMEREHILGQEERLADYKRPDKRYLFPLENPWADTKYVMRWVRDQFSHWVVGYGHEPWRALIWLIVIWLTATGLSHQAWKQGDFAPNSDVMLVSEGWQAKLGEANPAEAWSNKGEAGQDWESFNRYAWGLDLVVPILDIGQTAAWQPSKDRGPAGYRLWWARWVLEAMGWLVSALGVAAITGIMQKDRD